MGQRNNQAWVEELRGDCGSERQSDAHRELANYLYVVAYNYLRLRQADLRALADFAPEEVAALAQDFVQETLEKLARNEFALLASFSGAGKFTSWAAQIVRNQAAMELRKSYWTRRTPLPASDDSEESSEQPWLAQNLTDTSVRSGPGAARNSSRCRTSCSTASPGCRSATGWPSSTASPTTCAPNRSHRR